MARSPRIDFKGAWHHVMHRGARRSHIFLDDGHCAAFFARVAEAVDRFEIEVHAYSLMPNHYHLLVRTPRGNLSRAMRHVNAAYTQDMNAVHDWDGPLFRGRFRSELVRNEASLPFLLAYIHLNPLRAGLVTRLDSDCWTSHRAYLGRDPPPGWLTRAHFLGAFGSGKRLHDYVLDVRRKRIAWPEAMSLDTGWLNEEDASPSNRGERPGATRFRSPKAVIAAVRDATGAGNPELMTAVMGPRANPARRFAVFALDRWTELTHGGIGAALDMSVVQVANVLRRFDASEPGMRGWAEALEERLCDK